MIYQKGPLLFVGHAGAEVAITLESLIEAIIILTICVLIIITNVIIIATFITFPGHREVFTYYCLTLAIADLLAGVLVVPLSVFPTLLRQWVYGETLCKASAYLSNVLWIASMMTLMWMSVDRYIAIRKPVKYETIQTRTRVQCWVACSWIAALTLCCPPLLGSPPLHALATSGDALATSGAVYDKNASICLLGWNVMPAYAATLSSLLLGPTITTMIYNYVVIFSAMKRLKTDLPGLDKEYASALTETLDNPAHVTIFILLLFFWISWLPFLMINFFEYIVEWKIPVPHLHFSVFWLGLSNSFWKLVIYIVVNRNFRFQLRIFCLSICCRTKSRRLIRRSSD